MALQARAVLMRSYKGETVNDMPENEPTDTQDHCAVPMVGNYRFMYC